MLWDADKLPLTPEELLDEVPSLLPIELLSESTALTPPWTPIFFEMMFMLASILEESASL